MQVRGQASYIFIINEENEFHSWDKMLKRLVVQPDIWTSYQFSKLLGEGASGKVFLARKIDKPTEGGDSHKSFDSNITPFNEIQKDHVAIKVLDKARLQKSN